MVKILMKDGTIQSIPGAKYFSFNYRTNERTERVIVPDGATLVVTKERYTDTVAEFKEEDVVGAWREDEPEVKVACEK